MLKPSPLKHEPWTEAHREKVAHSNTEEAHKETAAVEKEKTGLTVNASDYPKTEKGKGWSKTSTIVTGENGKSYLEVIDSTDGGKKTKREPIYSIEGEKKQAVENKEQVDVVEGKKQPVKKKPFDFNSTKDFSTDEPQFGVDAKKEVPEKKPFDFSGTIDFNKTKPKTLGELQKTEKKEETSIVKNLNEEDKEVVEEVIEEKKPEVVEEEKVDDSWKNEYKNVTGKDADENNVTKEEARKLLDKTAIGKNVKQTPLVGRC